jgi:hypothetical protein
MSLNVAAPIRAAILAEASITDELALWEDEPAVFTRRPAPAGAVPVYAQIAPDISITNDDALISRRPIVVRDISFFGLLGAPGDAGDQYRAVERAAYATRALFHRKRFSLTVAGYSVVEVQASGPIEGPTVNPDLTCRIVTLTIKLREVA